MNSVGFFWTTLNPRGTVLESQLKAKSPGQKQKDGDFSTKHREVQGWVFAI